MTDHDNNKIIKSAIDDIIKPADGAKERMLANIKRKAETQTPADPAKKPMLKLAKLAAPLAACLAVAVITVVGVRVIPTLNKTSSTSEPPVQVSNPIRLVDSAAAFTEELGITLDAPEGATDIRYSIINNETADVSFVYNNTDYTLRASVKDGDFSGIHGTEISNEQLDDENNASLTTIQTDKAYLKLTWSNGETRYILSCEDYGTSNKPTTPKIPGHVTSANTDSADEIKEIYRLIK